MIKSSAKVTADKTVEGEVITILPQTSVTQQIVLSVWLVVWVISGLLALLGGLKEMPEDQRTFLFVFMGFWAYFLFYALRSLLWIRVGAEFVRIGTETLDYKRSWNGFGRVKSYDLATLKNIGVVNYSDKTFAKTYHDAFWTIGNEMIGFEYIGRKVAFGFKLNEQQASDIVREIHKAASRAIKSGN